MSRFTNSNKNKSLPRSRFWYQNRPKFTTGFTLIELLVVISIIALLSSVVLAALNGARTKAKVAAQSMAIDQTKKALQLYWTDHGSFPTSTAALVAGSYISAVDANLLTYEPKDSGGGECTGNEICEDYTIVPKPLASGEGGSTNVPGGEGEDPYVCTATGGDITFEDNYTIHTFTSSGSFDFISSPCNLEVLVIAGGGAGGTDAGGGGGAGGLIYKQNYIPNQINYPVTVGAGGTGGNKNPGKVLPVSGKNSIFGDLVAIGGGYGGYYLNYSAASGGSGGGKGTCGGGSPGSGTSGQGNAGSVSGGGGGAGAAATSLNGGEGLHFSQFESIGVTEGWFAGGGSANGGKGGSGGGGSGNNSNGIPNTGGGGGGGGCGAPGAIGGAGGSGIVIIKYLSL